MADNIKSEKIDGVRYITIPVSDNLDDGAIEALIRELAPPVVGIVGNYADVQRAGAKIAMGEKGADFASGVEAPVGVTEDDLKVTRQVNAAVEQAIADSASGEDNNTLKAADKK